MNAKGRCVRCGYNDIDYYAEKTIECPYCGHKCYRSKSIYRKMQRKSESYYCTNAMCAVRLVIISRTTPQHQALIEEEFNVSKAL